MSPYCCLIKSEGKFVFGFGGEFFLLWQSDCRLLCHCFDDNGFIWPYRADVFATAAADAYRRVGLRDHQIVAVRHHAHRLGRAVFSAGAAVGTVGFDDAEILLINHFTNFEKFFVFGHYWLDGHYRADLRTEITVLLAHAEIENQ